MNSDVVEVTVELWWRVSVDGFTGDGPREPPVIPRTPFLIVSLTPLKKDDDRDMLAEEAEEAEGAKEKPKAKGPEQPR